MFEQSTLSNGLRLLTCPMPHTRSAAVAFFIGGGSRYETDGQGGAFHFIEHLCFKGTQHHPTPREISETIEGVGGYMNASTDRELTTFWCKIAKPHLGTAVELLADMVCRPLFDADEMEKERGVILEELAMTLDHPDQRVSLLLDEVMWPDQPLGRDVGGTPSSVQSITRQALLSCMNSQYVPSNTVVSVAGDVSHQEVVELLRPYLEEWAPGEAHTWFPAQDGHIDSPVRLERRRSEQTHLELGLPGLSATHPQRYTLDLISILLGEGMSSRLFLELRERQGLVYTVNSSISRFRDTGALTIYAATDPRNAVRSLKTILGEMENLKRGLSEAELTKAKEMAKGRLLLRMEDTRSMAFWVGGQELLLDEVITVDETVARIDAVTTEEVQELANTLITPSQMRLAVVGPHRSQASFENLLG